VLPRLRQESLGSRGKQPRAKRSGLSAAFRMRSVPRPRISVCRTCRNRSRHAAP
jgi:hypothetical protein